MSRAVVISIFIVDITSVVLTLLGFLTAVSGLCLVKPEAVERATLGVFSSYAVCSRLHLGWVAIATIVVTIIHGVAGFYLWLSRIGVEASWLWLLGLLFIIWILYIYL
ncbi:MAG: hypothetical protein ACK4M3_05970 [Pyrobaculum sp.]